jgi:nicotinate-nucleotide adenylyltransferase
MALNPQSSILNPAVGVLGGSFDPIHLAHLQLARDARDALGLSEVRLVPAAQAWQKGPQTDAAHRAAMVQLAIESEPGLVLDLREIARGGPSYTIDTLRELRSQLGPNTPLVFIMGGDQIERLDTWNDWECLLYHAHIAVARRNNRVLVLNDVLHQWFNAHWVPADRLLLSPAGHVTEFPMTPVDAAATEIRQWLREPPSAQRDVRLTRIVAPAVLDYIDAHRLYH